MGSVDTAASTRSPEGRGPALLEEAIGYALRALEDVAPAALCRPTPCRGWDLETLLRHTGESLAALLEAVDTGRVRLVPRPEAGPEEGKDPVAVFREGAERLLGAWTEAAGPVTVGGSALCADLVAGTGAIEIAVHGWDVAQAAGRPRPVPPALAGALLELAPMLVSGATRHGLFAPPVPVPGTAGAGERLLAYLGRDPAGRPG
ncbi:TIGR03086 family metal-binding protein [Actinomadura litoris]|uniref:TIGR03086 family metal-binding protein n=1 Tax=Actinomadura litoris TaxID=2678616 RepID=UPI001FA77B15|nr:TIGR03086 family metal-binding protein [Actinomadura litoris]